MSERDEQRETEIAREMTTCAHFTGIHTRIGKSDPACKAGVSYRSVRDSSSVGPYRWPCLTIGGAAATTTCEKRQYPTRAEAEAAVNERHAHIEQFLGKLKANVCPHCDMPIEKIERVGRCGYARPCGHRIGQLGDDGDDE